MSKEVGLKSITIKVGAREIVLGVDEAKKMKEALDDLFGKEVIREVYVERWQNPIWYYHAPVWMSGESANSPWKSTWGQVFCSSSGNLSLEVKS